MKKADNTTRTLIGVILNLFIFVTTTSIMIYNICFRSGNSNPLGDFANGLGSLRMFTNESNLLCAIVALAAAVVAIFDFKACAKKTHHLLRVFQLIATTMTTLTFTVVAVFLMPLYGIKTGRPLELLSGEMLFTHLITPILAVLVFLFFTPDCTKFTLRDNFLAIVPVVLYGIIYFVNVVIIQVWPDFYSLTFGGQIQFVLVAFGVMVAITFAIANLLLRGRKKQGIVC